MAYPPFAVTLPLDVIVNIVFKIIKPTDINPTITNTLSLSLFILSYIKFSSNY